MIPRLREKLIINMFMDNTTLYLGENNCFDTIELKLLKWCKVSGAKFNIEKIEIIPIRTCKHRLEVVTTRKMNQRD